MAPRYGTDAVTRWSRTRRRIGTGAERSPTFAMQKVVGSSPIIRLEGRANGLVLVVGAVNSAGSVARFAWREVESTATCHEVQ